MPEQWSADERAAYRRFVRAHHPDTGGDPETFQAGIARFQQRRDGDHPTAAAVPPDRFAGPVVFVTRPRGWRRILARVLRRRRPPRVR